MPFNQAVATLRAAGATVIDLDAQGFTFPNTDNSEFLVLSFEFRQDVRKVLCHSRWRASCKWQPVYGHPV